VTDEIMARSGLQPRGVYTFSRSGIRFDYSDKPGIRLPNISGNYHYVLKQFFDFHGLGTECLLVSEVNKVKGGMEIIYPGVSFATVDFTLSIFFADGRLALRFHRI
jgi:hypothetical protein